MKSELRHLLAKLETDYPDFQQLIIASNGVTLAIRQHNIRRFETLDALEAYAWPPGAEQAPQAVESSVTLARLPGEGSAQDTTSPLATNPSPLVS